MNAVPLDFIQRVVNLLSYDDFYNVHADYYYSKNERENNQLYADVASRERHASAFSRLSTPWPQVVASRPRECKVNVCGDVYSIHEVVNVEDVFPRYYSILSDRQLRALSEVDLLTWNRKTHA
uniref:LEF-7 n=1 Tax=Steinernema glaseri TaxID=37863 RepID=A0A1I8A2B0_9BILA